jgi:hypothetical protein
MVKIKKDLKVDISVSNGEEVKEVKVVEKKAKKLKLSIKLAEDENYFITKCKSCVIVFTESSKDSNKTDVELILPNEEDIKPNEVSNQINLATAITVRLKTDPNFGVDLIKWFADYIQKLEIVSSTN